MERQENLVETDVTKRRLLLLVGHVCVLLGLIALILPVVPTSPFLVVGAACYARSSERFYNMLIENRYFGSSILRWEKHRCIERKMRYVAVAVLAVAFLSSAFLFFEMLAVRLGLIAVGLIAIVCVLLVPVCRDDAHR